jgi:glycosyltransferase involved in cell wall biosynthesis
MQSVRVICPTYWYPQHAADTNATYVHDINRHLVRRGHSVRVVTPQINGTAARETFDGVEVVRFPLTIPEDLSYGRVAHTRVNLAGNFRRMGTMFRYIVEQRRALLAEARDFSPDVVHAHWAIPTGPAAVTAAHALGVPSVITIHGGDVYVNPEQGYDFPTRWYIRPVLRWTLDQAEALTAITQDCRRHALNAGAREERMHIVLNGADLRRFTPVANGQQSVQRERYGPHMVFACRQLFPRKGIRFLIRAVALLKPRFPDIKLVLAGDGVERADLEKLAADLGIAGDTVFLGWVPNSQLPDYYRAAAVSAIPSLEEGFGIPAAEAMGCAIAVVASDAGGLPEIVEDGVTGRVVPRGDAAALAGAIGELLADERLRTDMGRHGRERALRLFDWDLSAKGFEELYQGILAGHPAAR